MKNKNRISKNISQILSLLVVTILFTGCASSVTSEHTDKDPERGSGDAPIISDEIINYETISNETIPDTTLKYGVFLGVEDEDVADAAMGYDIVAVDGQGTSAETVSILKRRSQTVFGYISIGSLETYRDYYDRFKGLALDPYDNWPDEYWVDVSDSSWQDFLVKELAPEIKAKGFDGIFADNADVYYLYETDKNYEALISIIKGIDDLGLKVIVNGGDMFVTRLIDEGKQSLIYGINQESVFSSITDYENDIFETQPDDEHEYFLQYIESAGRAGLKVFLLEYTKDSDLKQEIQDYCSNNNFCCYISESIKLDM